MRKLTTVTVMVTAVNNRWLIIPCEDYEYDIKDIDQGFQLHEEGYFVCF